MSKKDVVLRLDEGLADKVEEHRHKMSKAQGREIPRTFALQDLVETGLGIAAKTVVTKPAAPAVDRCAWFFCETGGEHDTLREMLDCKGGCR